MSEKRPATDSQPSDTPAPTDAQVEAFLLYNPEFLATRRGLLEQLTLPNDDDGNVIDFQTAIVQRLRENNERLQTAQQYLVGTARNNQSIQARVHDAVLVILRASSFETMIQTVTTDLAVLLDVDVVTIGVEVGDVPIPKAYAAGIKSLPEGSVDAMLGEKRDVMLSEGVKGDPRLFGAAAGLVRSQAVARLRASSQGPTGLLALGSRKEDGFAPGQATELLDFLSRVIEISIRRWLNLPN